MKKAKKGDRLLFLYIMGSDLAIEKRNFSAFDYQVFPMIRPDPRGYPLYSVPFFQEKTGCPSFFQAGCFEVKELKK